MKKFFIVLVSMLTVLDISTDKLKENVAYASNERMSVGELDHNSQKDTEKFKAEFAYEMAQITAKIISVPTTNVENFKAEFAYATAKVTAKVMPIIPNVQRNQFAYEMAKITTKIINDQSLDMEKAKAEFAYEIAQLTTKIITNTDDKTMVKAHNVDRKPKATNTDTDSQTILLRNNADIEVQATNKANVNSAYITQETYTGLIDELMDVGDRSNHLDNRVKIDGEIRYHYAVNSGQEKWGRDSAGIRTYLGFDTKINEGWRAYGMVEGKNNILNYDSKFELSRLFVAGKVGKSTLRAGSFGYLMAEGNIYDSGFDGVRIDFGEPVKYTLSYGKTNDTKETAIATARYDDFDYNLEAGVYHYQTDDDVRKQNTIWAMSGKYNFSNFSVGAMGLGSNMKDSKGDSRGYVFSLNYGDLKTYKPGTYDIFAKYYDQPKSTYIAHGMNGLGNAMQGFKGYGLGMHYTFAENLVGGIEYYRLTDKIWGNKGQTWWNQLSCYF